MHEALNKRLASMPCRVDWRRWFLVSAGLILLATGIGKCLAAIGPQRALDVPDPVFGIPFRQLFLGVGLLEQYVAILCLFGRRERLSLVVVARLASNFLLYRVGLWLVGWHGPCGCAGKLTDALSIAPSTGDAIMIAILGFLIIGSYSQLLVLAHERAQLPARIQTKNEGLPMANAALSSIPMRRVEGMPSH